ncbi:MAG: hypothetical protein R3A52_25465 [Polyangiales bacterium]
MHNATLHRALAAVLVALTACGGSATRGRAARLVSPSAEVDRALREADAATVAGELDRARSLLTRARGSAGEGPIVHLIALQEARVDLAEGTDEGLARAAAAVRAVPTGVDPALDLRRSLLDGLVRARRGDGAAGAAALRRVDGRMIDAAQNVEAWCGLAATEARAQSDDPAGRAVVAMSRVVRAASTGARWARTGLACDEAESREAAVRSLVGRVDDPQRLADAIDALPEGHALRRDLARRLRDIAPLHGGIHRWRSHLGDLDDAEAMLLPVTRDEGPATLRVTVLAPLSGPAAAYGVACVRAVQLAFTGESAVVVEIVDEVEGLDATLDRWATAPPPVVVGPALEDHARAVAERLRETPTRVFFPVPPPEGAARREGLVNVGPSPERRAELMVDASRAMGLRVTFVEGTAGGAQSWATLLRSEMASEAVTVTRTAAAGPTVTRVMFGLFAMDGRARLTGDEGALARRRVLDARAAPAGSLGHWVGAPAGSAFARVQEAFCAQTARPPGELALLYHDAARAVLESTREAPRERALAVTDQGEPELVQAWVRDADDAAVSAVAAARPCPSAP